MLADSSLLVLFSGLDGPPLDMLKLPVILDWPLQPIDLTTLKVKYQIKRKKLYPPKNQH